MTADPSTASISGFYERMQAGESSAAGRVFAHYLPQLERLARATIKRRGGRIEAEDVAQSAFVSFWQRARRGDFGSELHRHDIWNLLCRITVCKVYRRMRKEMSLKHGGGRVLNEADVAGDGGDSTPLEQQLATLPTQEFDAACKELLENLDDELRDIAILKIMGHTHREIAETLGRAERTIERKVEVLRETWKSELPA